MIPTSHRVHSRSSRYSRSQSRRVRLWRQLWSDSRASELVEFALSVMVLFTALFGITDFCRAMYAYHFVSWAAEAGTRYAMVRGADWGSTACTTPATFTCNATADNVKAYVRSLVTPGLDSDALTVAATWPGTNVNGSSTPCSTANAPGCVVKITVRYSFSFMMPFLPEASLPFTSTSQKVIHQ